MTRDFVLKLAIVVGTMAVTVALIEFLQLEFPLADLWSPLAVAAVLAAFAWYYRLKKVPEFVAPLVALMFISFYTACYSVLMYSAAAGPQPLVDDALMTFDALCHVHLPTIMQWAEDHPRIEVALQLAYNSLLWQTPLVIIILGFSGDLTPLRQFVLQFMLATWVCAVFLLLFPAAGPFTAYGYELNATQARYLQHLHELRDGVRTTVTWRGAEGLITFPSFHVVWAMLLAWSLRRRIWLFLPSVLLNAAVITATLTTGWHYFADVVAGVVLGLVTISIVHRITPWLSVRFPKADPQVELRLSHFSLQYAPATTSDSELEAILDKVEPEPERVLAD